jgi:hypothetical protein
LYQEPVVIENENKYQAFNFKIEQPLPLDKKQREKRALFGV